MRRTAIILALLALSVTLLATAAPAQQGEQALEEALLGFDPIELIAGSEVLGNSDITAVYNGLEYLFVTPENRDLFASDPQRYGIQMGNLCARLGRTTGGDQELYSIFDGRIYIFASDECVEIFEAAPERFLEPAPPSPLRRSASPEALARGDELVALALDALGGAIAIDGVENFVEETVIQRPINGEPVESVRTLTVDLQHQRIRREQPLSAGTFAQVWSHEGSWWQRLDFGGGYSPAQAENLGKELLMPYPVYILRMRDHELFAAASRGTGSAEVVEHVDVELGDYHWTLGIEPATGLLASITFVDRGPEGNWGEITHFFTDYRRVDGINWPHRRVVTFDGEAMPWWNTTTRAVRINAELGADLWVRAAGSGSE